MSDDTLLTLSSPRSRQQLKSYIQKNNDLGSTTDAAFAKYINQSLASGEKSGEFSRPKGPSGPVKLAQKGATSTTAAKTEKKPAAPKTTTAKVCVLPWFRRSNTLD